MSITLKSYSSGVSLLAATLLSIVSFIIVPRFPNTPDNVAYISMARGVYSSVPSPYRYRIIAPTLAGILPMQPANALRAVTVASLFFVYVLALKECALLGIGLPSSLLALGLSFCSRPNLFTYYNPFLTDALGMLVLFALTLAFITNKALPFTVIACLGVWNRESALFLVPAWLFTCRWKRGIALAAIVFVAFLLPRMLTPSAYNYASYLHDGFKQSGHGYSLSGIVSRAILSWQGMWLLAISSFTSIHRRMKIVALALVAGALMSCFVITSHLDYERMFFILAPVLVPCTAFVIERALRQSRLIVFLIAILSIVSLLFGNAYVFQTIPDSIRHVLLAITALLSFVICGYIAFSASRRQNASPDIPVANLPSY